MMLKYAIYNKYYTVMIAYFLLSIILKMFNIIDITIPCMVKYVYGFECWGCGLTRSFIELFKLNIFKSISYNPLIIIIIPSFMYFIIKDYVKFRNKNRNNL